jgi:hypothetical protein
MRHTGLKIAVIRLLPLCILRTTAGIAPSRAARTKLRPQAIAELFAKYFFLLDKLFSQH